MKKVRAFKDGFYGGNRIRAGEVFEIKEGVKVGKWMEVIEKAPAVVKEAGVKGKEAGVKV